MMPIGPAIAPLSAQLMMLVMLLGGLRVPLAIPPGPEDPWLARIAPDECLYYSSWAGVVAPDPNSDNLTEQLLSEPEVQRFLAQIEPQLRANLRLIAQRSGDSDGVRSVELGTTLVRLLLTRPTAIFMSNLERLDPQFIKAGLVVNLGPARAEAEQDLADLAGLLERGSIELQQVEIEGTQFTQLQPNPNVVRITWGIYGDYLIVGLGNGVVQGVFDRGETAEPTWLVEAKQLLPIQRRATVTYADLKTLVDLMLTYVDEPDVTTTVEALGLTGLHSYISVTGLDDDGFVSRTQFKLDDTPQGLLEMLDAPPLTPADLAPIPNDAIVAVAARLDGKQLLETLLNVVQEVQPEAGEGIDSLLDVWRQGLGVDLREDLLGSLGDVWRFYTSPREGGFLTGWTVSVSVRDADRLKQVQAKLLLAQREIGDQGGETVRVEASAFQDQTIHTLSIPLGIVPFSPCWCVTDEELVFALYPQAVKAHLDGSDNLPSLDQVPEVARQFERGMQPVVIQYRDTAASFRTVYPLLQIAMSSLSSGLRTGGLSLDASLLPSATSLTRHIRPAVSVTQTNNDGFRIELHETVPGGSVGATAPALIALTLPALQAAREAARRAQGINQLKQIMLALLNYESTTSRFPAAYATDAQGKPLLSWRVHILPFVEEPALYEQFHLDEPWDSEHNRKLIPLMPQLFMAPGSRSDPGKTNYLAIRDPNGVIVPPSKEDHGKPQPIGIRIRDITDGTSKTLCVVEASDALSVIWTKPDDFTPDENNPINGLIGLRTGGFSAARVDGSVSFYAEGIDLDLMRALYTRNGGEVTNGF